MEVVDPLVTGAPPLSVGTPEEKDEAPPVRETVKTTDITPPKLVYFTASRFAVVNAILWLIEWVFLLVHFISPNTDAGTTPGDSTAETKQPGQSDDEQKKPLPGDPENPSPAVVDSPPAPAPSEPEPADDGLQEDPSAAEKPQQPAPQPDPLPVVAKSVGPEPAGVSLPSHPDPKPAPAVLNDPPVDPKPAAVASGQVGQKKVEVVPLTDPEKICDAIYNTISNGSKTGNTINALNSGLKANGVDVRLAIPFCYLVYDLTQEPHEPSVRTLAELTKYFNNKGEVDTFVKRLVSHIPANIIDLTRFPILCDSSAPRIVGTNWPPPSPDEICDAMCDIFSGKKTKRGGLDIYNKVASVGIDEALVVPFYFLAKEMGKDGTGPSQRTRDELLKHFGDEEAVNGFIGQLNDRKGEIPSMQACLNAIKNTGMTPLGDSWPDLDESQLPQKPSIAEEMCSKICAIFLGSNDCRPYVIERTINGFGYGELTPCFYHLVLELMRESREPSGRTIAELKQCFRNSEEANRFVGALRGRSNLSDIQNSKPFRSLSRFYQPDWPDLDPKKLISPKDKCNIICDVLLKEEELSGVAIGAAISDAGIADELTVSFLHLTVELGKEENPSGRTMHELGKHFKDKEEISEFIATLRGRDIDKISKGKRFLALKAHYRVGDSWPDSKSENKFKPNPQQPTPAASSKHPSQPVAQPVNQPLAGSATPWSHEPLESHAILSRLCGQLSGNNAISAADASQEMYSVKRQRFTSDAKLKCDNLFKKISAGNMHLLTEEEKKLVQHFCSIIKCVSSENDVLFSDFNCLCEAFNSRIAALAFVARILARKEGDIPGVTADHQELDYAVLADRTHFHVATSKFATSSYAGRIAFFASNYRKTTMRKLELATAATLAQPGKFTRFSELLSDDGLLDKSKLEEAIVALIAYEKTSGIPEQMEKLKKLLQIHEDFDAIQASLKTIDADKFSKNLRIKNLAMFAKLGSMIPSPQTLRKLVFNATFDVPVRQEAKVGSCFVTGPVIQLQANDPEKMLSLMAVAVIEGSLPLFNAGKNSMKIPLNDSEGIADKEADISKPSEEVCTRSLQNMLMRTLADGEMQGGFDSRCNNLREAVELVNKIMDTCRRFDDIDQAKVPKWHFGFSYDTSISISAWDLASADGPRNLDADESLGAWIPHVRTDGSTEKKTLSRMDFLSLIRQLKQIVPKTHANTTAALKSLETALDSGAIQVVHGGSETKIIAEIYGPNYMGHRWPYNATSPDDLLNFVWEELLIEKIEANRGSHVVPIDLYQTVAQIKSSSDVVNMSGRGHAYTINLSKNTELRSLLENGASALEVAQQMEEGQFYGIFDTNWNNKTTLGFLKKEGVLHIAATRTGVPEPVIIPFLGSNPLAATMVCPDFLKLDLQVAHIRQ
ncbi:MAG: hypothetical protein LBS68_01985 [Puniceicoccales bacterium]|nr:hypothetical protein [Puniceicoccales bacterium]